MEIKDNVFQDNLKPQPHKVTVEYFQEKKIFLTKIHAPDGYEDEEFLTDFLNIMKLQ
jgi:hypothetical protein